MRPALARPLLTMLVLVATVATATGARDPTGGTHRTLRCGNASPYPIRIELDDAPYDATRDRYARPSVSIVVETGPGATTVLYAPNIAGRTRAAHGNSVRYSAKRAGTTFSAKLTDEAIVKMRLRAKPSKHPTPDEAPFNVRLSLTEADVTSVEVVMDH